ncbi:MAG: glycosyltransferase family 2 protein [Bacteroidetes bacterium]|nr:MAG: glycosyltransferase family 2 protein [Bacteroidota bacterium]
MPNAGPKPRVKQLQAIFCGPHQALLVLVPTRYFCSMISVVVITKNEAHCIGRCLASLAGVVAEVVVVDSQSTDATVAIAQAAGAKVLIQPWLSFGPQKNVGANAATHPWILSLDADECLSPELAAELQQLVQRGMQGVYSFHFLHHYYGKPVHYGLENPQHKLRLYNRNEATWNSDAVHERLEFNSTVTITPLQGRLLHYGYINMEQHAQKSNRYSTLGAQAMFAKGRTSHRWKLWVSPAFTFFRAYVIKRGFLDGQLGFVLARWNAYTTWMKYAKLWALWQQKKP